METLVLALVMLPVALLVPVLVFMPTRFVVSRFYAWAFYGLIAGMSIDLVLFVVGGAAILLAGFYIGPSGR
ncbi:MAG: hypothetical protein HY323_07245 [Betaproteobacteria bacterium]|nr:hypothetical protein [Betaproteobacteria bacterium]